MMNIPQKLLIDVEKTNNVSGHPIISKDGRVIQYIISGKMIVPIPSNERTNKIYKLFEENCDLIFCTTNKMEDFPFYPVPTLVIFAVDSKGNHFGTIGDMGGLESNDCSVGYINQEGRYCKISGSFKDFLELATFYPYWRDVVEYEQMGVVYNIVDIEMKQKRNNSQFFANQREIAETLKLCKNPQAIELLITNMKSPPGFVVYGSKDEAKKENKFLEDIDFAEYEYAGNVNFDEYSLDIEK
jgi:hypothetical protein